MVRHKNCADALNPGWPKVDFLDLLEIEGL
jgi:hypothetical protein